MREPERGTGGGQGAITVRLPSVEVLLGALEPAPEARAEAWLHRLDGLARDLSADPGRRAERVRLLAEDGGDTGSLARLWRDLCRARAEANRRQARAVRRDGWVALRYGALCFAAALALSAGFEHLEPLPRWINRPLSEGFLIASWVSLWRPIELLLYEWLPWGRLERAFEALGRAAVEVVPAGERGGPEAPPAADGPARGA